MPASTPRSADGLRPLFLKPIRRGDLSIWREIHAQDDGMMYALPSTDGDLWRTLVHANAHFIYDGVECCIGTVTLTIGEPGIASIGVIIQKSFRGRGFGAAALRLIERDLAPKLGVRVLRADVYAENQSMIDLLVADGFREYRNFEKNIASH